MGGLVKGLLCLLSSRLATGAWLSPGGGGPARPGRCPNREPQVRRWSTRCPEETWTPTSW